MQHCIDISRSQSKFYYFIRFELKFSRSSQKFSSAVKLTDFFRFSRSAVYPGRKYQKEKVDLMSCDDSKNENDEKLTTIKLISSEEIARLKTIKYNFLLLYENQGNNLKNCQQLRIQKIIFLTEGPKHELFMSTSLEFILFHF